HQAHHRRQHRTADEDVGELHRPLLLGYWSTGTGRASAVGCTALLMVSGEPLRSFSWPAVTTVSPSLTPVSTAIWSPRAAPVVTKVCFATDVFLPFTSCSLTR